MVIAPQTRLPHPIQVKPNTAVLWPLSRALSFITGVAVLILMPLIFRDLVIKPSSNASSATVATAQNSGNAEGDRRCGAHPESPGLSYVTPHKAVRALGIPRALNASRGVTEKWCLQVELATLWSGAGYS